MWEYSRLAAQSSETALRQLQQAPWQCEKICAAGEATAASHRATAQNQSLLTQVSRQKRLDRPGVVEQGGEEGRVEGRSGLGR